MSFGFGAGDLVLVSHGAIRFWTTVHNARTEQAELAKIHRLLGGFVQRITDCGHVLGPKLATTSITLEQQLSLCVNLLRNLDEIAIKYMGYSPPASDLEIKTQRRRLFLWGMYKRDEFVESLEKLRQVVVLLLTYVTFEITAPASFSNSSSNRETLWLIDALNRETVCSISMCDTWEVSD